MRHALLVQVQGFRDRPVRAPPSATADAAGARHHSLLLALIANPNAVPCSPNSKEAKRSGLMDHNNSRLRHLPTRYAPNLRYLDALGLSETDQSRQKKCLLFPTGSRSDDAPGRRWDTGKRSRVCSCLGRVISSPAVAQGRPCWPPPSFTSCGRPFVDQTTRFADGALEGGRREYGHIYIDTDAVLDQLLERRFRSRM